MMSEKEKMAEVLEKAAAYVEAVEDKYSSLLESHQTAQHEQRKKEAEALAEAIGQATGEIPDLDIVMKIAASDDDDIKSLFQKLASTEEAEALGTGDDRGRGAIKTASTDAADEQFLSWLLAGN
jgi:hypothetical protein